ncbi:hypothetical protein GCM10020220_114450 [Nonomuraea rubra]
MSVLQPKIDDGTLKVASGQTDFKQAAILRGTPPRRRSAWRTSSPQTYTGSTKVDGVLSPYDGLSIGILSALKSSGYSKPYPIVTVRTRSCSR